jgi:hypothetical protein
MNYSQASMHRVAIVLVLLYAAVLPILSHQRALAQDEPVTVLLGQYVFADLAADDSRTYQLDITESASYLISAVDENAAAAFDLIVTDAAGNELFNDIFGTIELALEPGIVTLNFVAAEEGALAFSVLGRIGTMSDDSNQPGKLPSGAVYTEDRVSSDRYANLTVPATPYPQQVLLYVEAGEEDVFTVSAEGEEIGSLSMTTDVDNILRFWTQGGEYLITVSPVERRSTFTIIPFLSGPPAALTLDQPLEGAIVAGTSESIYELTLDTAFDALAIQLESEDVGLTIRLVDKLYGGNVGESSFGAPTLEAQALLPGTYYVIVEGGEVAESDIPYTLTAGGTAGTPLTRLENGVPAEGELAADQASMTYEFIVDQPGALVTVSLSSDAEETDFDLAAGLRAEQNIWTSYEFGSNDTLDFVAPVAGTYYISVLSNGGVGPYTITVTQNDLAPEVAINGVTWGTVEGYAQNVYRLEIPEPGRLLTIILVGSEATDVDIWVAAYNAAGDTVHYLSGFSTGSSEIVSQSSAEVGVYELVVRSSTDQSSEYYVLTRLEDPSTLVGQWAITATATSQYGEDNYSPMQATGEPNTLVFGDYPTAWASQEAEGGVQELELGYEHAVVPSAINLYETNAPGAVIAIDGYDAANDEWVVLWEGDADSARTPGVFSPPITNPGFAIDTIRVVLDTDAVGGWNEIDAVELVGRP